MTSGAQFPDGTYYAVTWGLEADHGGMTNAMLHRSRAIVRASGRPVTIVTYDHQDDLARTCDTLVERGALIDGMSVLNMWEDLRTWDDARLQRFREIATIGAEHFAPLPVDPDAHPARYEEVFRDDGLFTQRDYRRDDGTLLVSHRRFVHGEKGVVVTLCDTKGEPIGWLPGIREFYRFWLDSLPRDPVAFMVIDSKTAANHYPELRRDDVCTLYMVHGSHLADGETSPFGRLSNGRRHTFERLRDFDAVVLLTEAQRRDVQEAYGPLENLHVCPNSRTISDPPHDLASRPKERGIALGALVKGKRFSHAIRAVRAARRRGARVSLDIYGEGPQRAGLTKVVADHELETSVRLEGYTARPMDALARASFLLMTSNREGFGLVLIEAMSQGCIPIAYDIRYGPSDIITDGVDGFLVPPGDIRALAWAIVRLYLMRPRRRLAMREAAIRRAGDFNDETVCRHWAEIFTATLEAKNAT